MESGDVEMSKRLPIIRDNTPEEELALRRSIEADADTAEVTASRRVVRVGRPSGQTKTQVTVRLDKDLLEKLKSPEPRGWQTRLNSVLRNALKDPA